MEVSGEFRVCGVISVDPGLTNVGLCELDDEWRVVDLRHSALPHSAQLSRLHFERRPEWIHILAQDVYEWVRRHIFPRLLFLNRETDDELLVVVEENDLAITRDWAGILTGILAGCQGVRVVTVLPTHVKAWMVKHGMPAKASRYQKKKFAVDFVSSLEMGEREDGCKLIVDDHSADACLNALYIRERFFLRKRNAHNKHTQ